jgi:hypothetical protein
MRGREGSRARGGTAITERARSGAVAALVFKRRLSGQKRRVERIIAGGTGREARESKVAGAMVAAVARARHSRKVMSDRFFPRRSS